MFTGIVEELGSVKEITRADSGARIEIPAVVSLKAQLKVRALQ